MIIVSPARHYAYTATETADAAEFRRTLVPDNALARALPRHRVHILGMPREAGAHPIACVRFTALDVRVAEYYLDWSGFGSVLQPCALAGNPSTEQPVRRLTRDTVPMERDTLPKDLLSFFEWLRVRSEEAWEHWPEPTLRQFQAAGAGGSAWRPGTRWAGSLTDEQILAAEQTYGIVFPDDYRAFLRTLHALDRSTFYAGFGDGDLLIEGEGTAFFNWVTDRDAITQAMEWPREGLVSAAVPGTPGWWQEDWGAPPNTETEARLQIDALLRTAPPLIPVVGHRYLVEADTPQGYVVLSVYGPDVVVYAQNLRHLLLTHLADVVALPERGGVRPNLVQHYQAAQRIPVWGRLVS